MSDPLLAPLVALAAALAAQSATQSEAVGQAGHGIGNPVPDELLRPLSPDRPNSTESPQTVDAGRTQFEVSIGDWSRERRDDVVVALQTIAKVGLSHDSDLQLIFDTFVVQDNASGTDEEGFGDLTVRYKKNLWGNDGETDSALALLPFVKIPTGTDLSNDEVEGGLAVPYSTSLTDGIGLGLMGQLQANYDGADDEHELGFLHTAVLGFSHGGGTSSYVEFAGFAVDDIYDGSVNAGLLHQPSRDLMFDAGVRLGVTDDANDLGVFIGFTYRH